MRKSNLLAFQPRTLSWTFYKNVGVTRGGNKMCVFVRLCDRNYLWDESIRIRNRRTKSYYCALHLQLQSLARDFCNKVTDSQLFIYMYLNGGRQLWRRRGACPREQVHVLLSWFFLRKRDDERSELNLPTLQFLLHLPLPMSISIYVHTDTNIYGN